MKKATRHIFIVIVYIFFWPFLLYKKEGNTSYNIEDGTIIVSNHYSNLDAFFIYLVYGRKKKIWFVADKDLKQRFFPRIIASLFDCLYVEQEKPNLGFFKQATKILSDGGVVCIFPEGFVNPRKYGFFDFKASYILLAEKSDAKILPVYLYPDLTAFKRSRIYIGTPVSMQEYGKYTDRDEASAYIQSMIMEYASEIN